jgi:hypothetical protein
VAGSRLPLAVRGTGSRERLPGSSGCTVLVDVALASLQEAPCSLVAPRLVPPRLRWGSLGQVVLPCTRQPFQDSIHLLIISQVEYKALLLQITLQREETLWSP